MVNLLELRHRRRQLIAQIKQDELIILVAAPQCIRNGDVVYVFVLRKAWINCKHRPCYLWINHLSNLQASSSNSHTSRPGWIHSFSWNGCRQQYFDIRKNEGGTPGRQNLTSSH